MILRILDHGYHYELENICRLFYPYDKIITVGDGESGGVDNRVVETRLIRAQRITARVDVSLDGRSASASAEVGLPADEGCDENERVLAVLLYGLLSDMTGSAPPWGILTGVRPAKLMNQKIAQLGEAGARAYFRDALLVLDEKIDLATRVAEAQSKVVGEISPNSMSLYVAIPFCPSRCSYCSFVSHSITGANAKKLVGEYVEKLCDELRATASAANEAGLETQTVYFGGGTPTSLSAEQLEILLNTLGECFDLSRLREYTVEAGRPDTLSPEKLRVLKQNGVSRISINPQTFDDTVLEQIGRRHTGQQALDAFAMARNEGFDNINADLIAGLPGDTSEGFVKTLETALSLSPESITVHTLALKRSSRLVTDGELSGLDSSQTAAMLSHAHACLTDAGYVPYYMYRQSRCVGNLENVGWCLPGYEGLYNIFMMEECHTVLAAGAGGVTRLRDPYGDKIERIFNFKYPYEYTERFGEIMDRKKGINEFYARCRRNSNAR